MLPYKMVPVSLFIHEKRHPEKGLFYNFIRYLNMIHKILMTAYSQLTFIIVNVLGVAKTYTEC